MEETCEPANETQAERISYPEDRCAFSTDRAMAAVAPSKSTITPRLIPCEGSIPTPIMRKSLPSSIFATRVQILVVPISIPTIVRSSIII